MPQRGGADNRVPRGHSKKTETEKCAREPGKKWFGSDACGKKKRTKKTRVREAPRERCRQEETRRRRPQRRKAWREEARWGKKPEVKRTPKQERDNPGRELNNPPRFCSNWGKGSVTGWPEPTHTQDRIVLPLPVVCRNTTGQPPMRGERQARRGKEEGQEGRRRQCKRARRRMRSGTETRREETEEKQNKRKMRRLYKARGAWRLESGFSPTREKRTTKRQTEGRVPRRPWEAERRILPHFWRSVA
ncbi:hypothetical protein NDU88_007794 [Pleurodeles waltl]|uniref:Uncharacterized protein n=1 Tax=Pleurodeles waltl TaxID=8319 RepID=A0AAV7QSW4_PLEWA|nr:hypothetical protein NDU88_007794 [Pleurodeles waltl]